MFTVPGDMATVQGGKMLVTSPTLGYRDRFRPCPQASSDGMILYVINVRGINMQDKMVSNSLGIVANFTRTTALGKAPEDGASFAKFTVGFGE